MSGDVSLDPKRPWIKDPDDLPGNMSWLGTMFNPTGQSSQVPYTRVWTLLFFVNLILVPATIMTLFSNRSVGFVLFAIHVLLTFISFVIHLRRLSDAGRSSYWAAIVLAPLILGSVMFYIQAKKMVVVANGIVAVSQLSEAAEKIQAKSGESGSARRANSSPRRARGGRGGGRRGGRGRGGGGGGQGGPQFDPANFDPADLVFSGSLPFALMAWVPLSFISMLISLMWVARLPRAKRIDLSQPADMHAQY